MIGENKVQIAQSLRTAVWNKYIGKRYIKYYCFAGCGNIIRRNNFQCGHIQAESVGGPTNIENLRPICKTCNCSMGTENMFSYMKRNNRQAFAKTKQCKSHTKKDKRCKLPVAKGRRTYCHIHSKGK